MVLDADAAMTPVLSQNQCVVTRTSRLVSGRHRGWWWLTSSRTWREYETIKNMYLLPVDLAPPPAGFFGCQVTKSFLAS